MTETRGERHTGRKRFPDGSAHRPATGTWATAGLAGLLVLLVAAPAWAGGLSWAYPARSSET